MCVYMIVYRKWAEPHFIYMRRYTAQQGHSRIAMIANSRLLVLISSLTHFADHMELLTPAYADLPQTPPVRVTLW